MREQAARDDVLDERARVLARPRTVAPVAGTSHLVATVAGMEVAVPTARARGVVAARPLTQVPASGTAILGLAAVHGELVPVGDLSLLVRGEPRGPIAGGQLLLVDDRGAPLGFQVDRVRGVVAIPARSGTGISDDGVVVLDLDAVLVDPRLWPPSGATDPADPVDPHGGTPR